MFPSLMLSCQLLRYVRFEDPLMLFPQSGSDYLCHTNLLIGVQVFTDPDYLKARINILKIVVPYAK